MDAATGVALYGIAAAAVAVTLVALRDRIGALRAAAWLITLGAVLMLGEDGALAAWYALAPPTVDPDGVAGVAPPHTRAHMLGSAAWTLVAAALVVWLAHARLRRADRGAWWALAGALVVGGLADVAAYLSLYSHGLPFGAEGGFGWPPVAVYLGAWAAGLAVARARLSP